MIERFYGSRDRKILWITSARVVGDEFGQINWDQITKYLEFHVENQGLDAVEYGETLQVLNQESNMMTIVFLQDLSLSWALKGSKQGKSGGKETREIIEMGQYGWTLCLVLFSFCLVTLDFISQ